jgi:carbon-monoxide dehydrogenase medium subunit
LKAPPFSYVRATTLAQVFELKEQHGDEARVLAGGQSLMAALNMRLDAPAVLIDINGLDDLAGVSRENGALMIGALTRHVELEHSDLVAEHAPLISQAMPDIAHPAIRNRGTIGGSLALSDPAAELPACTIALDAEILLASKNGQRAVRAREFFLALYETARDENEMIIGVRIPDGPATRKSVFSEIVPRKGDFASAGLAATAEIDGGTIRNLALAYFGVADRAIWAEGAGAAAEGASLSVDGLDGLVDRVNQVLDQELETAADLHNSAKMKSHLARVLTGRALARMAA